MPKSVVFRDDLKHTSQANLILVILQTRQAPGRVRQEAEGPEGLGCVNRKGRGSFSDCTTEVKSHAQIAMELSLSTQAP